MCVDVSLQLMSAAAVLLYPGLILIDHGHFQYPLTPVFAVNFNLPIALRVVMVLTQSTGTTYNSTEMKFFLDLLEIQLHQPGVGALGCAAAGEGKRPVGVHRVLSRAELQADGAVSRDAFFLLSPEFGVAGQGILVRLCCRMLRLR